MLERIDEDEASVSGEECNSSPMMDRNKAHDKESDQH